MMCLYAHMKDSTYLLWWHGGVIECIGLITMVYTLSQNHSQYLHRQRVSSLYLFAAYIRQRTPYSQRLPRESLFRVVCAGALGELWYLFSQCPGCYTTEQGKGAIRDDNALLFRHIVSCIPRDSILHRLSLRLSTVLFFRKREKFTAVFLYLQNSSHMTPFLVAAAEAGDERISDTLRILEFMYLHVSQTACGSPRLKPEGKKKIVGLSREQLALFS